MSMSLHRKLLLSMFIPALLLGMMAAIGVYSLRHLEQAADQILADNYRSIQAARKMTRALGALEVPLDERLGEDASRARSQAAARFEEALGQCEGNITEAGEIEILRRIRANWERVGPTFPQAPSRHIDEVQSLDSQGLHADIEELVTLNERAMIASASETRRIARGMEGAVVFSALGAFIALALFAILSAHRISQPVTEVANRLHRALNPAPRETPTPAVRGVDEIARLREELEALIARLARYEDEQARRLVHLQGRLAFVMSTVLEGLVLIDTEHRILAANRVGRTILGMGPGEGQRVEDLTPREDVRRLLGPVRDGTFQSERDLGEVRFDVDGNERVFRPRVLPVPAAGGAVEGYLIMFWDVTEQRRFEESRRRFISMLSHQLKTPMTSLTMSVNLVRERLEDAAPAQAELLAIATENCNSLSALVSDLIEAARETTPDLALKPHRLDLVRLLRSALRPLVPQAEEKGILLVVPSAEPAVHANVDPVKFPWVVTNIAGNALRYTERGGRVEVVVSESEGQVQVSVEDTGVGIARENLNRIFEPYVSLGLEPRLGTHGLGLAIAKEIVEAHGGTIEVDSEQGRGTRFLISLPSDWSET
jgi:NtrC-family two-component system sensor histidine kinase KinB